MYILCRGLVGWRVVGQETGFDGWGVTSPTWPPPTSRLHGKGPPPFLRDLLMPRLCLRARPLLCYQLLNCSEPDPRCTINCSPPYIPAASICFRARRQSHNSLLQPLIYFLLCLHQWTWKYLGLFVSVFKLEVVEWLLLSLSLKKFRIVKVLVPVCVQIGSGGVVAVVTWGPLTC